MVKAVAHQKPNTRPDKSHAVAMGKFLREQRLAMGIKSVKELVDLIDQHVAVPPDLVTEKQIYNLEGAVKAQSFNIFELGVLAALAAELLAKNPRLRYLYNHKKKRAYKAVELAAIGMGWIDAHTGEFVEGLDIDPKVQSKLLDN